jgi:hypothetical protein
LKLATVIVWSGVLFEKLRVAEFPAVYGIPKVHYRVDKSAPLVTILTHTNPLHTVTSCFFKTNFNVILPFATVASAVSVS